MDNFFASSCQSTLIAGVDEAGRGPLAGDVVTAAVILDPDRPIAGLNDSKKLTESKRLRLFRIICEESLCWCVARASVAEIDSLNILQASLLAMKRAVEGLKIQPEYVLVDGNRTPDWDYASQPVVKGDARVAAIAAASILAKVTRDREMHDYEVQYPGYGFAQHKGYPTEMHRNAIQCLGISPIHRRTYGPVKALIAKNDRNSLPKTVL